MACDSNFMYTIFQYPNDTNAKNMTLRIIGGSSHTQFTSAVCTHLGIKETPTTSKVFDNDNRFVTVEDAVRGDDVYIIATQARPVDAHLMELYMLLRAVKIASATRVTAVLPYLPYSRSDKRDLPRVTVTARLIADLIETAGANHVLVADLHAPQIQGFFSIPCDVLYAAPEIVVYLKKNWNLKDYALVGGDAGAAKLLKLYADGLKLPVAIMDKRRDPNTGAVSVKGVIGDVRGKKALIIDDETQTGSTLIKDAEFLLKRGGAVSVDACVIHPALGPSAAKNLNKSPIKRFVTTDTIPTEGHNLRDHEIVSMTKKFADCIGRMHENKSIKSLNDL